MVNRSFLYWGVFFVAIGAVLLVGQGNLVSSDTVAQALVLWPVVFIAAGVALVLRRTRLGLAGGVVAAALPGLLLGGVVVAAPQMDTFHVWPPFITPHDCHVAQASSYTTREGSFDSDARVTIDLTCGDVETSVIPGSSWRLEVGDTGVPAPRIDTSGDSLSIQSTGRRQPFAADNGDLWRVALPDGRRLDISSTVDAGTGNFDLAGARLGDLDLQVNAGDVGVDLTNATLDTLQLRANAGAVRVQLPGASDPTVNVNANAAKVSLCAPAGVGLRVHQTVMLGSTQLNGLVASGDAWQSPDYATAPHHADVTLGVNVGSVDINPEGGCK